MENYSSKQTYALIKRLYYFIEKHADRIEFKRLRGASGYYYVETDEIEIDPRRDITATLIHEFLHHLHSTWSEYEVGMEERKIMRSLSMKQLKNIIAKLVSLV